jgi:hypothetical protein
MRTVVAQADQVDGCNYARSTPIRKSTSQTAMIFEPFQIKNLYFKNRIVRSSIGGRTSYYDGTVTSAFKNFEKRFAENDVAAIITATISVDEKRASPMEYPSLSHDRFIKPLREAAKAVQQYDCRYIIQIGDTGGHTHTSLFAQPEDAKSSSVHLDALYGYHSLTQAMTIEEIEKTIAEFGERPTGVTRSLAEAIADAAPGARVVKAFNTTGANNMLNPRYGAQNADMFICGDDATAKATVAGLSRDIGFDVVDAGPLSAALSLENLAQLWVHLARSGAGREIAWKLMRRE